MTNVDEFVTIKDGRSSWASCQTRLETAGVDGAGTQLINELVVPVRRTVDNREGDTQR